MKTSILLTVAGCFILLPAAFAFEGHITAAFTGGGQPTALLYTVGTNSLRVENTATNRPNTVDLLDLPSGELTLLFPNNRSFVRLKAIVANATAMSSGIPALPPGVGPQPVSQAISPSIGPTNLPGMSSCPTPPPMPAIPNLPAAGGMPAMPMMPPPMMEHMELKATGEKTNLLGFACEQFQIKQRGQIMEIWATDMLLPFQPYVQNQPHRFGPRMIEEQWGELLKAKKLFPLIAVLKFENGPVRYRFEVKKIQSGKMTGADVKQFLPPPEYREIHPLPF
ncbi:MAG: DUF4412 domain-containing protein [Verrucomicrobiota bacterium]